MMKRVWHFRLIGTGVLSGLIAISSLLASAQASDWRSASRASIGIAPDPTVTREAVVQVYAARAWGWRGWFGVHSWIAVKPENAPDFTVYEVIGWRSYRGQSTVAVSNRDADGRWFGSDPMIVSDVRGDGASEIIERIDNAVSSYPHADDYRVWPGPNSNTFIAHVAREIPELRVDLPPTAIGKDYIPEGGLFAQAPSGTGYQFSLFGVLGLMVAAEEGLELNVLGFTFGIDPLDLAVKLPGLGRIGFDNRN